jgi:hypothetical protein
VLHRQRIPLGAKPTPVCSSADIGYCAIVDLEDVLDTSGIAVEVSAKELAAVRRLIFSYSCNRDGRDERPKLDGLRRRPAQLFRK